MKCVLDLVVFDLFLEVDCLLQSYQLFLIDHQQVSGFNLASKFSFLVLLIDSKYLSWLRRLILLFKMFGYVECCILTISDALN